MRFEHGIDQFLDVLILKSPGAVVFQRRGTRVAV
jgi:hypothetical protein